MTAGWEALILGFCALAGVSGTALWIGDRRKLQAQGLERFVWSAALGLAALGYLVFVIGSLGWLKKEVFLVILSVLLIIGWRRFLTAAKSLAGAGWSAFGLCGGMEKILIIPVAAVLFFSLAAALAPATGQDELCYHLTQPQNFVREQAVYAVPFSVNALWPYLAHMLFTLGMLVQGAEGAKVFHWLFYVLTALAVAAFVKRTVSGRAAWFASAAYLVTPASFLQAGFAYIDHALALYTFLAFYAACAWKESGSRGWAWLAGIAAGLAASVKLIGLFAAAPVAVLAVIALQASRDRRARAGDIARILAGMTVAGAAWYVRSWILRGNPVYPFFSNLFNGHGYVDPTYIAAHARGTGLTAFILLPWDVTFHPGFFGGEVMGPLFLALAPLVFIWSRAEAVRLAALSLAVYAAVWFKVDPNIRFFFVGFAWLSVMAGVAADAILGQTSRVWRHAMTGVFVTLVMLQAALAPYHFREEARLLFGGDRSAYLDQHERSSSAVRALNAFLGADDWVLSAGESRGFYFKSRFTLDGDFEHMTPASERPRQPKELARYLKAFGFTHVLLVDAKPGAENAGDSDVERVILDRDLSRPYFKDEAVVRSRGRQYVLYRIL